MASGVDSDRGILLTGATGFLGGEVLARQLERRDRPVYVLVRARTAKEARTRLRRTLISLLGRAEPWSQRVTAIPADLTTPGLGLTPERRRWVAERT